MARLLLSYHQVTPVFLEFLFPFRKQSHKKNFDFSGFRAIESQPDRHLHSPTSPPSLTNRFELCYNLRCVESTANPPEWPWSMRQTATYHSFDLCQGNAVWINIKGNTELSPRVANILQKAAPSDPEIILDVASSLYASLATHLVYCEWAGENWAAYVGFLEDQLQTKTRYALLADVPTPKQAITGVKKVARAQTAPQRLDRRSTMSSIAGVGRSFTRLFQTEAAVRFSASPQPIAEMTELQTNEVPEVENDASDFTYDDLREIQHIEDQANITVLAIRSNVSIIKDLAGYYMGLSESHDFKSALGTSCDSALQRFQARMKSIVNDLLLHQSRVETLLQLLSDRKSLVSSPWDLMNTFADCSVAPTTLRTSQHVHH